MCPRIYEEDVSYYQSSGGDWFTLKDDMQVARVQFMFETTDEIPTFAVHKVVVGQTDRYVNCLREPGQPLDTCPFCAAGLAPQVVRIVVMFDHGDEKVKIWERGKTFIATLQGHMNRYSPFGSQVFEIERHGKAGSKETKYQVFHMDNVPAFDLTGVEVPELFGTLIIDASFEDQDYYLQTGNFPPDPTQVPAQAPVTRRVPAVAPAVAPAPMQQARAPRQQTVAPAVAPAPQVPRQAPQSRAVQPPAQPSTVIPSRRNAAKAGSETF